MYHLNDSVVIRLVLDTGVDEEDLLLLGRRGTIVQIGTQYPEKSYSVQLDGLPYPLAFWGQELGEVSCPAGRRAACQECHFLGGYSERESIGECETYLLTSWSNDGLFALLCGQKGMAVDGCTCPRSGVYYCSWCQSLATRAGLVLATRSAKER